MPSSRATSAPCSGPAPPKATSTKSRGSSPFCSVRERIAFAILALTMVRMPSAASSSDRPSCSASPPTRRARPRDRAASRRRGNSRDRVGRAPDWRRSRSAPCPLCHSRRARVRRRRSAARRETRRLVDPGDRAAARADRVDVDHRRQDRKRRSGVARGRLGEPPADGDADIDGRAADIEGHQLLATRSSPDQAPPSTPAAGPDSRVSTGLWRHRRCGRDPSIRAHHMQIGGQPGAPDPPSRRST